MRPVVAESQHMRVADIKVQLEAGKAGRDMHQLIAELYPICRSITGDGLRETLRRIGEYIPLNVQEVASGTLVFDWTVPKEWNIRDAYIKDSEANGSWTSSAPTCTSSTTVFRYTKPCRWRS